MTKQGKFEQRYAQELLRIANQDLESARFLVGQSRPRVENIFLLAQQGLEKALKGVLCWKNQPIPFVHEIGILVTKIESLGLSPPFGYQLNGLSEFATIRRYLEGQETWAPEEIAEVLTQVSQAIDWCHQQII
jgi:HEPN domain-containing protein